MYRIFLPNNFNIETVSEFYESVMTQIDEERPDKICFDFRELEFIEPAGVVTISNMVEYIKRALPFGVQIKYRVPDDYVQRPRSYYAVDYLDDSLFFQKIMGKKQHPGSSQRSTTNGLEKLDMGHYNFEYIQNTISWLKGNVNLRTKSFSVLETALGEVFNNINDHSGSPVGGHAFAQHYPKKNEITFCIADTGMGVPTRMRTKFTNNELGEKLLADSTAMKYATLPKVSTETRPSNRGMGFDTLLKIIECNQGEMIILSNRGKLTYNYQYDENRIPGKIRLYEAKNSYPGTLIMLNFRTDTLDIEEEEDLEWILS